IAPGISSAIVTTRSPAGTSPPRVSKTRSTGPLSTTAAPACRASWTAMCPTPPEAPVTSTRSPRASRPCTNNACQAVSPPIGWDDGVLGSHAVAIERRERIYLVTAADDNARKLVRRNRRQSIDRPLQLVTCNRCRMHAHQHLARIRRRRLDLLNLQAVIVQPYREHTAPPAP